MGVGVRAWATLKEVTSVISQRLHLMVGRICRLLTEHHNCHVWPLLSPLKAPGQPERRDRRCPWFWLHDVLHSGKTSDHIYLCAAELLVELRVSLVLQASEKKMFFDYVYVLCVLLHTCSQQVHMHVEVRSSSLVSYSIILHLIYQSRVSLLIHSSPIQPVELTSLIWGSGLCLSCTVITARPPWSPGVTEVLGT